MSLDLTPDQQQQLRDLGINISQSTTNISNEIKTTHISPPSTGQILPPTIVSSQSNRLLPLLSISGLTLISFGGLILFKTKSNQQIPSPLITDHSSPITAPTPTQVPKSIQHYLLTSQQYFTQALTEQSNQQKDQLATLLNQAITTATAAITDFPSDYRGYEQRGRIYQSLIDSQPQTLSLAITDLTHASTLNPNSAEITRTLATLYARQGNAQSTINYLAQTVSLEPTRAQNFYDLARIQQQVGQLPAALDTYNRLISLVSDPTQRTQIESEKSAIERLISQSSNNKNPVSSFQNPVSPSPTAPPQTEGSLIQADAGTGLIIAAPETSKDISVHNLVDSNSLSGTATLPANQLSLTISNDKITSTSQVYLTVVKGGKNLSLQVLSKSLGSFVVGLDSPTTENIEFKWWIIN
ncbi:MAG: hypothetical protein WAV41_02390 [Microgenomates group bacterium]